MAVNAGGNGTGTTSKTKANKKAIKYIHINQSCIGKFFLIYYSYYNAGFLFSFANLRNSPCWQSA